MVAGSNPAGGTKAFILNSLLAIYNFKRMSFERRSGEKLEFKSLPEGAAHLRQAVLAWENEHPETRTIILVAGPSAAGKETFVGQLQLDAAVLNLDRYYLGRELMQERYGKVNFSIPKALDQERIERDVEAISAAKPGEAVSVPVYDMKDSRRVGEEKFIIKPRLIMEGVYAFVLAPFDTSFRVYVDAEDSVRLNRKLARDSKKRGLSEEEIRERFFNTAKPAVEKFCEPQKENATIIVHNNEKA